MAARAMLDALPTTAGWQSEIATVIEDAGAEPSAALTKWAASRASDPGFAGPVYRGAVQADLGGQMFVRLVEVPEAKRALADGELFDVSFLDMPFDEAIEAFSERRLMSPEEFRRLSDAARTRAFTATRLATENLIARAQTLLAEALANGSTLSEFVAALRSDEVSLGVTASSSGYLETVFRTNVQASYGAGRFRQLTSPAVVAARPFVEYRTVRDDRVRPTHAELDGKVFRQDDPAWPQFAPPNGFNCFPGETLVQGATVAAIRARYAGELVELATHSGRRLTVTPNHPLATPDGFVAAGCVREGQEVLGYDAGHQLAVVGALDPEDAPARIQDVFDALAVRDGARLGVAPEDLHGDAKRGDGHVDVVAVDRVLLERLQSEATKDGRDCVLASPLPALAGEAGRGGLGKLGVAPDAAAHGVVCRSRLPLPSGGPHGLPLQPLRIGLAAALDASLSEPAGHDVAGDARFLRDLVLRGAGSVAADKVISVRRVDFVGHVYDLQTVGGWMVAGGIVASNCRCVTVARRAEDVGEVTDAASLTVRPDPGFDAPPTVTLEEP